MANSWFRFYCEFANDPKVQMMSEAMQRRLVLLFCLRCEGKPIETYRETELAFKWRISMEDLAATKELFLAQGFIDGKWNPLNWNKRQFLSDSSTERVRKYRQALKQDETLHETALERSTVLHETGSSVSVSVPESEIAFSPDMVASAVLVDCRIAGREARMNLEQIASAEMKAGQTAEVLREKMVGAYRRYEAAKSKLSYTKGAAKFFGDGDWRNELGWPWKEGMTPKAPVKKRLTAEEEYYREHPDGAEIRVPEVGA